jgi:hypothetical protein
MGLFQTRLVLKTSFAYQAASNVMGHSLGGGARNTGFFTPAL